MTPNKNSYIHDWLARISYSSKIKFIIALCAVISIVAILNLLALQNPFIQTIRTQMATACIVKDWTYLISSSDSDSFDKLLTEFESSLDKFFDQYKVEPSLQQYVSVLLGKVKQLQSSFELGLINQSELIKEKNQLNSDFFSYIVGMIDLQMGTDVLTYHLADSLYYNAPHNQISLLKFNLTALNNTFSNNELIEVENRPSELLQLANRMENCEDSSSIECWNAKALLQKKLAFTLHAILKNQNYSLSLRQIFSFISVFLGLLIVLAVYSTRLIRTPLAALRAAAHQIAQGQLWQRADQQSHDEVGQMCQNFNAMATVMQKAVSSTSEVSVKLTDTISTIVSSAKDFEQNVSDQDKHISQIAVNTVGIAETAKGVAHALQAALKVANETSAYSDSAQFSIHAMESVLRQTALSTQHIIRTLRQLEEKVGSLNAIISTIINVADEANLLAINTALSSQTDKNSRSGFGIIANKIGELASQTAFVTLKMEDSVKEILKSLAKAIDQVRRIQEKMHDNSEAASSIVNQFEGIMQTATAQAYTCNQIQNGIRQQEKSAEQIHDTVTLISQGAKITTRSVKNLYLEIQYLSEASTNLQSILKRFSLSANAK